MFLSLCMPLPSGKGSDRKKEAERTAVVGRAAQPLAQLEIDSPCREFPRLYHVCEHKKKRPTRTPPRQLPLPPHSSHTHKNRPPPPNKAMYVLLAPFPRFLEQHSTLRPFSTWHAGKLHSIRQPLTRARYVSRVTKQERRQKQTPRDESRIPTFERPGDRSFSLPPHA